MPWISHGVSRVLSIGQQMRRGCGVSFHQQRTNGRNRLCSAMCRFCCKSPKLPGDIFPARRQTNPRSLIDIASGSLPKPPVSLSSGDEVPHMSTRKPRLQPGKFSIRGAKRLLQHNLPAADIPSHETTLSFGYAILFWRKIWMPPKYLSGFRSVPGR
jgi:hypothetical protein